MTRRRVCGSTGLRKTATALASLAFWVTSSHPRHYHRDIARNESLARLARNPQPSSTGIARSSRINSGRVIKCSGEGRSVRPSRNRLRIAQIAPLYERIPPKFYGGTERVVSYITEELVRRGHEGTLFASGDAVTKAKLIAGCPQALRLIGKQDIGACLQLPMICEAYENASSFNVIHSHIDYWAFPCARLSAVASVATMHGRLELPDLALYMKSTARCFGLD
jgi:hypothetical protein